MLAQIRRTSEISARLREVQRALDEHATTLDPHALWREALQRGGRTPSPTDVRSSSNLPDDRDIVIDAKTSLLAYEKYVNAEDDEKRALYAKSHLEAVKAHIDRLSDKSYTSLEEINTLDFIFMFMPIEGALMLALQEDPRLYERAFGRHIVLVSPTTLLVALRAVENTWRHERQNRNNPYAIYSQQGKIQCYRHDRPY
jgi:hypothetical protein